MKNVKCSVNGQVMTITVDLSQDLGASASGKTHLVATTEGNAEIPGFPGFKLGVNLYKPIPKKGGGSF